VSTTATSGKRKKRFSIALDCYEIPPILDTLAYLIHDGYTMGIYQVTAIQRHRHYIDDSSIKFNDCNADEILAITTSLNVLKTNLAKGQTDLDNLEQEAMEVETERTIWAQQWQNISEQQRLLTIQRFEQLIVNETALNNEVRCSINNLIY
jgi:hypothetical protein